MESFSWSDNIRAALAPCLACLHTPHDADDDEQRAQHDHRPTTARGPDYVPRARADELEGLLTDTDDAETLSLHSNIGQDNGRGRKRQRPRKGIRLFGFDLFGRRQAIELPEDDDVWGGHTMSPGEADRRRTISTSTLDSDAAPLDPSTIDALSAARAAEGAAQREQERIAKEERRRRRRERKAAKEAALALALEHGQDEFEGFPGSGPSYPDGLMSPGTASTDEPSSAGYDYDDFGPFEHAQTQFTREPTDDVDVDGADFGAEAYAKRPRKGGSSGTGSDSRSRTSASRSDSSQFNHHYLSQSQAPQIRSPLAANTGRHQRKKSSRQSTSTASQSNSISSPPAQYTTFPHVAPYDRSPLAEEAPFQPEDDSQDVITIDTPNGFPSVGFSGGMRRKNSETSGVFLATRGD